MSEKAIAQRAYEAAGGSLEGFGEWWDENIVEFDCGDCGEHVVRPRHDTVDIDGLTPARCGPCTLDRMAES